MKCLLGVCVSIKIVAKSVFKNAPPSSYRMNKKDQIGIAYSRYEFNIHTNILALDDIPKSTSIIIGFEA